jgi:hypothetical protein
MWLRLALVFACCMSAGPAFGFGPEGHRTIGAIADRLLVGTNAGAQVESILGGLTLQEAGVWADCVKGVDPTRGFAYTAAGRYPECKVFEMGPLEAEMSDFVRRNDTNCARRRTDESCHKRYHYTDVAIQRSLYAARYVGARDDDVVAALVAAIRVLRGEPAAPPFEIRNPREALLLLAHLVATFTSRSTSAPCISTRRAAALIRMGLESMRRTTRGVAIASWPWPRRTTAPPRVCIICGMRCPRRKR